MCVEGLLFLYILVLMDFLLKKEVEKRKKMMLNDVLQLRCSMIGSLTRCFIRHLVTFLFCE